MVYPLPEKNVRSSPDIIAPINKSPFAVVATLPLLGEALVPWAAAPASSEFAEARPEYSRIAKRKVAPEIESATVTVLKPLLIPSA